ncbi:MAG: superoxide dismutase family protein [Sphingobium sp.]
MPTHRLLPLLSLGALVALGGGAALQAQGASQHAGHGGAPGKPPLAWAKLLDAQGREAGRVRLAAGEHGLDGVVDVTGIAPGAHGIHLHTTGKCEAPDFASAGGHLNPDARQHGLQNPQGSHQGDLPDLIVGADGKGHGMFTAHTTEATIFDADGTAFVVHAAPDDGKTDPSGNSGARILCGVLEKPVKRNR